ncbi:A/G-specific adenine glycosylase [Dokdonia pacifica]|uniref:Adenine DNA glycosylase n=2 Tax=Dokdonia pacifica TaxID=1627892 RepID=A0A238WVP0_9FLAO|nr:A/G-specific adenine glycosylase [Dokdonia pacifica]SNR49689.1 A/G-specific DNA-adenine glycosylase [Dokdonia pacifica]
MPWRQTTDPYRIWLSEIILQQTRVAQGLPYYLKFTETFPTVHDLANASEEEVLKLWQGLGYYSRGRNLHAAAKYIVEDCEGIFPNTYKELLKLKGVGDYTASAIASISFNEPTAVVDGNVYRVLSRYFGIDTPINSTQGIKEFKALAQELIDIEQPANFNQAIMEFGAIQCKPQNPYCLHCIFNDSCVALQKNSINTLPVKLKKIKVKNRYLNYLVFKSSDHKTIIERRTGKGIWQGLYQFPMIEGEFDVSRFRESELFLKKTAAYTIKSIEQHNIKPIVHKLSHQHLHTIFWIIDVEKLDDTALEIKTLTSHPVPVLIEKFIVAYFNLK